jgi:hypothetical protein
MSLTIPSLIRIPSPLPVPEGISLNKHGVEASSQVKFDFLSEVRLEHLTEEIPDSDIDNVSGIDTLNATEGLHE